MTLHWTLKAAVGVWAGTFVLVVLWFMIVWQPFKPLLVPDGKGPQKGQTEICQSKENTYWCTPEEKKKQDWDALNVTMFFILLVLTAPFFTVGAIIQYPRAEDALTLLLSFLVSPITGILIYWLLFKAIDKFRKNRKQHHHSPF